MKDRVDRCWLFDLTAQAISSDGGQAISGLSLGSTGAPAMVEDDLAVRQAILLLLSTRPGERVMRPDYGCHLHRLVFAPNDAGTAGLAIHYVREALRRWEPRVEVVHLDAGAGLSGRNDETVLEIMLEYRIRHTQSRGRLDLGYDLHSARLISLPAMINPQ